MNKKNGISRVAALVGFLTALFVWSFALGAPSDALHIKEIKQGSDESLMAFLLRFPESFEAQIFYGLFGSGLLGSLASYAWKWSKGLANGSHWTVRYVVGQVLWLAGISVAAIVSIDFQTESGEFFGWLSVLWSGGFAGFSGEVKFKLPSRETWTPEERAAKAGGAPGTGG